MILDDGFNIGIVHIGSEGVGQQCAVDEFISFMDEYYPFGCVYTQSYHPFVEPHEHGGSVWLQDPVYLKANLDMSKVPIGQQVIVLLWECCCSDDNVWSAGGAFGADNGIAGAATASVPTNGCGVWWFGTPQHGFDYWGSQIMVHEVRNVVSWYYNTYYVPVGYPELPDTYAEYCDSFSTLRECYISWCALLGDAISGHSNTHGVDFVVPVGSSLVID